MSKLKARLLVGGFLAAAAVGLSACGDDNDTAVVTPTPTPTPTPSARFSDFGAGFATRFAATANSDAAEAGPGDFQATAPSLTTEPQEVS